MSPDEIKELARATIKKEAASVLSLVDQIDDSFVDVAQALLNCKGHVLVAGSGTSHAVGARLAHLLSCSGTPSLFIHPGDSQQPRVRVEEHLPYHVRLARAAVHGLLLLPLGLRGSDVDDCV